jgi:MinD superfamily P-loop ATPase
MKIAVLSGKGGTGKTLVSVSLAAVAKKSTYIDCDVEEPNGHLFFKPDAVSIEKVSVKVPVVDEKLCQGCRKCVEFCKFNALAYIMGNLMIFNEICHSCGGCMLLCPVQALSEKERDIGEIHSGFSENVAVITGILNTGEATGTPIIKKLLSDIPREKDYAFIDCPPGSACIVMDSIKDADYCILVAEPTIFGAHNLNMVYELVKIFNKPHGVVLNKCLEGDNPAESFCKEKDIKILGRIPFDHELGELNSQAIIAARENDRFNALFSNLLETVAEEARYATTFNP